MTLALQPRLRAQNIVRPALTTEKEVIERIQAVILLGARCYRPRSVLRQAVHSSTFRWYRDAPFLIVGAPTWRVSPFLIASMLSRHV